MIPCFNFERQTEVSEIIMCLSSHLGLVEVESCEFKSEYSTKKCPILVWPPNMGSWHEVDKLSSAELLYTWLHVSISDH